MCPPHVVPSTTTALPVNPANQQVLPCDASSAFLCFCRFSVQIHASALPRILWTLPGSHTPISTKLNLLSHAALDCPVVLNGAEPPGGSSMTDPKTLDPPKPWTPPHAVAGKEVVAPCSLPLA